MNFVFAELKSYNMSVGVKFLLAVWEWLLYSALRLTLAVTSLEVSPVWFPRGLGGGDELLDRALSALRLLSAQPVCFQAQHDSGLANRSGIFKSLENAQFPRHLDLMCPSRNNKHAVNELPPALYGPACCSLADLARWICRRATSRESTVNINSSKHL